MFKPASVKLFCRDLVHWKAILCLELSRFFFLQPISLCSPPCCAQSISHPLVLRPWASLFAYLLFVSALFTHHCIGIPLGILFPSPSPQTHIYPHWLHPHFSSSSSFSPQYLLHLPCQCLVDRLISLPELFPPVLYPYACPRAVAPSTSGCAAFSLLFSPSCTALQPGQPRVNPCF